MELTVLPPDVNASVFDFTVAGERQASATASVRCAAWASRRWKRW